MTEDIIKDSSKKVDNGDTISVDYVGKLEDGTVFDTSLKEAAVEAGIYNQMRDYEPLTFAVGAGQMIKGFDEGVVISKEPGVHCRGRPLVRPDHFSGLGPALEP